MTISKVLDTLIVGFRLFVKEKISKPVFFVLEHCYIRLFNYPRPLSIALLLITAGFLISLSVVLWCVLFSTFLGAPLLILKATSIYNFTVYTITSWIELYRLAWLASAAEYTLNHDFGPIPTYILYLNTLKYSALYYPNIVVFNLLLVFYLVLFGHCFGVMLYGLIMQRPKVEFKINVWHIAFRMLMLIIVLIVFVWCPPVFGPGVPANFETGDPLNPIDWSKADCANPFASDWSHQHLTALYLLLFLVFSLSLLSYGIYQVVNLFKDIKALFKTKKHLVPGPLLRAQPLLNKKMAFALIAVLLVIVVCYLYWVSPELIHQALDYAQAWAWKGVSFICRVLLRALNWFVKAVTLQTASCHDSNEGSKSSSSFNNKSSSWFSSRRWGSRDSKSSSTKRDDFIGTMTNKAKNTSDQCDQKLKQTLNDVDNQPLTPRRDAMRKDHAWAIHKECKKRVGAYFETLQEFGHNYSKKEQSQQTPSAYSGSYDIKNKKIEVKYESGK